MSVEVPVHGSRVRSDDGPFETSIEAPYRTDPTHSRPVKTWLSLIGLPIPAPVLTLNSWPFNGGAKPPFMTKARCDSSSYSISVGAPTGSVPTAVEPPV